MGLYLKQLELGPMKNFVYLVGDTDAKKCWIVDPAWNVEDAVAQAEKDGYSLEGALITHAHYDHCNALDRLLALRDMPVYAQAREQEIARAEAETGVFRPLPAGHLKTVASGDKISLGGTTLTFLHTPGHTPGSQCFLVADKLIAGDTLFLGTCGRCDLPGGNPYEMFDSLNRVIGGLPGSTVLFPGHNYSAEGTSAPLETERRRNRFLQAKSLGDFLDMTGL